jgi:sigma-B regulation protein RsbU (phosphoserine phosphatase)
MMETVDFGGFVTKKMTVKPGSKLYVYSDGCVEIYKTDKTDWTFGEFVDLMIGYAKTDPKPDDGCRNDMERLLRYVRKIHGDDLLDDDFSIVDVTF